MNFPNAQWGCESDLRKCVGKAIEAVELLQMEWGCTWEKAWLVRFTDGSRAFFAGQPGTGIMNPREEAVRDSALFTPEEYGELVASKKRAAERRAREQEKSERRELERLQAKFSTVPAPDHEEDDRDGGEG